MANRDDGAVDDESVTFRDPVLEAEFRRNGYLVVQFADADLRQQLLDAYEAYDSGISTGYYPSLMSRDNDYKRAVDRTIRRLLWPALDALLVGYQPLLGDFMVKHPGPSTEVPPHQDWIVADESRRPTISAWCPLVPITAEVGEMRVLPSSNSWLEGYRGSPTFPTQWETVWERVRDELMVGVPLELGQAMVYDVRILHGTRPNVSDATRVVASLYGIPDDASRQHYYRSPDGTVAGFVVDDGFYTSFNIGEMPAGEPFTKIPDYAIEPLSFEEIAERYRARR